MTNKTRIMEKEKWLEQMKAGETPSLEDLPGLPSDRVVQSIAKAGTPDQVERIHLLVKAHRLVNGGSISEEPTEKGKQYLKKLNTPSTVGGEDQIRKRALAFFQQSKRKSARPGEITYDLTRKVLWDFYHSMVVEKMGVNPGDVKLKMKDEAKATFRNFTYWMIGSKKGEWDPAKSLYLWGDTGSGKSTLVKAARKVMAFYRREFNWGEYAFEFVSFAEVFSRVQTDQDLTDFKRMAVGNWAFDELRDEHLNFKYYGNDLQLVQNLLTGRYNGWEDKLERTIITSNIAPKNLPRLFVDQSGAADKRLLHRMEQQYHFEEMINYDFRHPKFRL